MAGGGDFWGGLPPPLLFLALLGAVVVRLAERLERTAPEQRHVPAMRRDVIAHRGGRDPALGATGAAQRFVRELMGAEPLPAGRPVKGPRGARGAAAAIGGGLRRVSGGLGARTASGPELGWTHRHALGKQKPRTREAPGLRVHQC